MILVKMEKVTKYFKDFKALNNLTLEFNYGRLYLLIGENGSGKSTIIKLISKIITLQKADRGRIIYNTKKIGYLPDKYILPKYINALDFIRLYTKNYNMTKPLADFLVPNKLIASMSKGMQQKVGIIAIMYSDNDLYLFDEPLDGLDLTSKELFRKKINEYINIGKTVIIATHNADFYRILNPIIYKIHLGSIIDEEIN